MGALVPYGTQMHLSARRRRCLPPGARTSIGTCRLGRPKLPRIPTPPTTLWGLRVRQDGERGQGEVTLGRSAGGRVVGAMESVLHGPPPLLMPLDHVCPLPKVCSRGLS